MGEFKEKQKINTEELTRHNNKLYIPNNPTVRAEIFRINYNNF